MQLTKGQEQAMNMVQNLLDEEESAFGILTGYAGTGKTTLLKEISKVHGQPVILTPTGKAALRVGEATGNRASTIHRWLYKAIQDPKTGETKWVLRPVNEIMMPENHLVVIDEASMVGQDIWADIWGFCKMVGLKLLLVGDPFQLPPVAKIGAPPFSALELSTPHKAQLTEVLRQALDNPIIRASMMVRESESGAMDALELLRYIPGSQTLTYAEATWKQGGVVIAHTNNKRQELNQNIRKVLGKGTELEPSEPLLVLYNNYSIDRFNGEVLTFDGWNENPKGAVGVRDRFKNISYLMRFGVAEVEGQLVTLSPEEVFADTSGMPEATIKRAAKAYAEDKLGYDKAEAPSHLNANLGYCLTCHKSQGSEWNQVLVIVEPSVRFSSYEGRRWIYTAITRARESVYITFTG